MVLYMQNTRFRSNNFIINGALETIVILNKGDCMSRLVSDKIGSTSMMAARLVDEVLTLQLTSTVGLDMEALRSITLPIARREALTFLHFFRAVVAIPFIFLR
jgi:hypothetical protein